MWATYQIEETECVPDVCCENQRDLMISGLKSRLFDLEQQEKDNNYLCQKFNQLKRDYCLLCNMKNKLEQEIEDKDQEYNKNIDELCNKNENLKKEYNDKLAANKKLFKDNDDLEKEIEAKDDEIDRLKKKLKKLNNQLNNGIDDEGDLEDDVKKLKAATDSQAKEINRLKDDNKNLNDIANDQQRRLNKIEDEIANFRRKSDENDMDIDNLNNKLRDIINYTNGIQSELDKNNADNKLLKEKIKDGLTQCKTFSHDNVFLNNNILKERALRSDKERQNDCLNGSICESDNCINYLSDKYNMVTSLFNQATNESKCFQANNDRLKDHLILSTQQNQELLGELEDVKEQDLVLKTMVERDNIRSCRLLNEVQNSIDQDNAYLNNIEKNTLNSYCSRGNSPSQCSRCRARSPSYVYERRE